MTDVKVDPTDQTRIVSDDQPTITDSTAPIAAPAVVHSHAKKDKQVFRYSDHFSTFSLWWKAVLLVPIWGIIVVPLIGGIFGRMGEAAIQLTYSFIFAFFMSRFFEDVLKCKIRIENGVLFFGYRNYPLADLVSAGLQYKENQVLPKALVFNFKNGRKLSLKLTRLRTEDIDRILRHIESRYPNAKIDPVIRTLHKCKKLVRNTALESENAVEIPYHSRRIFRQLLDTFMQTAEKWIRVGPLIAFALCSPVWLSYVTNMFTTFLKDGYSVSQSIALKKGLETLIEKISGSVGNHLTDAGTWLTTVIENPLTALLLISATVTTVYYLARFFFRPNVIMLEPNAMSLQLRLFNTTIDVGKVTYDSLVNSYLIKPRNSADPEKWKIAFNRNNNKPPFILSLGALSPDNRTRFVRALERLAPECSIDAELAEAMMPRQERSYTELWLQSLSAPPERKSLEPLAPAQQLLEGKYEVVRRLGVGGQGLAYLCKDNTAADENRESEVVLKETILPVFVEAAVRQQALERFRHEAELLEKLDHNGIVKLVDYFIEDHRGYLVLEHINGKTLRQVVEAEGPLSEERARNLASQMCDILDYLHKNGVIHRDFTPDNLILRHDGKLKLIDFNVAQQAQDGTTGTIVGKHAFLPPEQFRGKPTFQSDIYAMGATLFYLTTGKDPEPITRSHPREHNPDISEDLDSIVARCTELQCTKRMPSAEKVVGALHCSARSATEETPING